MSKQKDTKSQDKIFMLDELADSMALSIDNVKKIIEQNKVLIDVINASDKAKMFERFVKDMEASIQKNEAQVKELSYRAKRIKEAVKLAKDNLSCNIAVTAMIEGLGMFK